MRDDNLHRFMALHRDYESLWQWSVTERDEFWASVWRFCGVKSSKRWDCVTEAGERVRWFPGARLNYAENILRYQDHAPAIISCNSNGLQSTLTHKELYAQVSRVAHALRASGVKCGDRVAAVLPNVAEAVIAFLAVASIGATWVSCGLEVTEDEAVARFSAVRPKVLIGAGKGVRGIALRLPGLRLTVVLGLHEEVIDLRGVPRGIRWQDEILFSRSGAILFEQLPFEHPLLFLGAGGFRHGAGNLLIQHMKEVVLQCGIRSQDRVLMDFGCGSMQWYWMVSALSIGAAIVLYQGDSEGLAGAVEASGASVLGTCSKRLILMQKTYVFDTFCTVLSYGREESGSAGRVVRMRGGDEIGSHYELGVPGLGMLAPYPTMPID